MRDRFSTWKRAYIHWFSDCWKDIGLASKCNLLQVGTGSWKSHIKLSRDCQLHKIHTTFIAPAKNSFRSRSTRRNWRICFPRRYIIPRHTIAQYLAGHRTSYICIIPFIEQFSPSVVSFRFSKHCKRHRGGNILLRKATFLPAYYLCVAFSSVKYQ